MSLFCFQIWFFSFVFFAHDFILMILNIFFHVHHIFTRHSLFGQTVHIHTDINFVLPHHIIEMLFSATRILFSPEKIWSTFYLFYDTVFHHFFFYCDCDCICMIHYGDEKEKLESLLFYQDFHLKHRTTPINRHGYRELKTKNKWTYLYNITEGAQIFCEQFKE